MSIVLRVLGQNFIARGLGGTTAPTPGSDAVEEVTLNISSTINYDKQFYPITGTIAGVSGWKWNKTIPQTKSIQSERIESKIGGHKANLEEGSVVSHWFGNALHGLGFEKVLLKQWKTKRNIWMPMINTGVYSIFNFSKKLYSNYSSCKVVKNLTTETIEESEYKTFSFPEGIKEDSLNIYMFKRDTNFNNIPYRTFKYQSSLEDSYTYKIDGNKILFLNETKREIGTSSTDIELVQGFDELLGIGNFKRRTFYTEYFPAINPILKTVSLDVVYSWTRVDNFNNTSDSQRHYIFDEETGKVILNPNNKVVLHMKSYDATKKYLEVFYPLEGLSPIGKLLIDNVEVSYKDASKYGFYLENEFNSFVEGKEVVVLSPGKKLETSEQIYISYEHVPRLDFEVESGLFWNESLNVKPYTKINSNGILEVGIEEKHLAKINLTCDKEEIIENVFQTLYIQQDFTILSATAFNSNDKPLEELDITFHSEEGAFEGDALREITEVTNSLGKAHTSFSYPYQDNTLCSVSASYRIGDDSYLKIENAPAGLTINDISVFQILKTDSYYGSTGLKVGATNIVTSDDTFYKITLDREILEKEDYQSNQMYLSTNDPDRIVRENLLEDGNVNKNAFNFSTCLIEFNNGTSSVKAAVKQIVDDVLYVYINRNIKRAIILGQSISGVRLFKKDELEFKDSSLTKDTRGLNRVLYSYNTSNERYERVKPTRIQGNKIWFDNILLPESSVTDPDNIIAGYKIIMPKGVKLYATSIDEATGIEIRSNTITIKVDFPNYLKTDLGFKFKEESNEDSSGLGGTNFISLNPDFVNSQINFYVEN